ncbi:M48 family metalloprotease [Andreprevotia chitinilytica]|uniref:M48 family metalloprotease n=1 Tax=Andreprevotia chitinilytica TaxID=396808 RepID=UPI000552E852|nr:M48 family metalloprotease [Andreprevotia chitinilytica]
MKSTRCLSAIALSLALALPAGADDLNTTLPSLPDLGASSQEGLTGAQERQIGESAMREIRRSGELLDDAQVQAYVNALGSKLVDASGSDIQFTFFPVDNKQVNAFSIPGGYVGVNTGLIVMAQHESELAAVLSHEIAHNTQHHLARMVEGLRFTPWMMLASLGLAILAARAGNGDAGMAAVATGQGLAIQKQLDFTYAFEQEADRIGMQTLTKSGFDPAAMPTFFERLQKSNRLFESNAPEFLRTHPVTYKRIADAEARLKDRAYKQYPDSADFLFMRERARVLQGQAKELVEYYQKSLIEKRYTNLPAHLYGLALAQLQAHQLAEAEKSLASAKQAFGAKHSHPALESLTGDIQLAEGKSQDAVATYAKAVRQFPDKTSLRYGQLDAMLSAGQAPEALKLVQEYEVSYPSDALFYQRESRIQEKLGKQAEKHKAQAEYYARLNENGAAIEQLQLAKSQPGGDFYLMSGIEARLRELEAQNKLDNENKPKL